MSTDHLPARNEFYRSPEFIASILVIIIFLFDFLPFYHLRAFLMEQRLSGIGTLEVFTEHLSFIYYLFYFVPIAAVYLAIRPFLKEGTATAYANVAKYLIFAGLTLFFVFKLIGFGKLEGGLGGLGLGFYVAWIASWFLPFEQKMLSLVQEGRQRAADVVQQNKGEQS